MRKESQYVYGVSTQVLFWKDTATSKNYEEEKAKNKNMSFGWGEISRSGIVESC